MVTTAEKPTSIFVYDDIHPEDNAMLQALYSRSPDSVVNHLEKVKASGSGKFMASYYVGYGHASIGDCGSTTIFIENVSIAVAKAIQDNPLYSGQEASTRYLDFSQQPTIDPYNHPASRAILDKAMATYTTYMPLVLAGLKERYPFNPVEYKKEAVWEKAVQVRAFDTMRGLLPMGITTLLSWHTNLRQARDHLRYLYAHPLAEVRYVAKKIFAILLEKYPYSFNGEELKDDSERYAERNVYAQSIAEDNFFTHPSTILEEMTDEQIAEVRNYGMVFNSKLYDAESLNEKGQAYLTRPRGTLLPRHLGKYGVCRMKFLLDYKSHHDLHRHRNGICPMPLLTGMFGLHEWYRSELELSLSPIDYANLIADVNAQYDAVANLQTVIPAANDIDNQYMYPMGTSCLLDIAYSLPQMVYVSELRSPKTVHPTLRPIAQMMARNIQKIHPDLKLYVDYDADSWTAKRGDQDIVEKKKTA